MGGDTIGGGGWERRAQDHIWVYGGETDCKDDGEADPDMYKPNNLMWGCIKTPRPFTHPEMASSFFSCYHFLVFWLHACTWCFCSTKEVIQLKPSITYDDLLMNYFHLRFSDIHH